MRYTNALLTDAEILNTIPDQREIQLTVRTFKVKRNDPK